MGYLTPWVPESSYRSYGQETVTLARARKAVQVRASTRISGPPSGSPWTSLAAGRTSREITAKSGSSWIRGPGKMMEGRPVTRTASPTRRDAIKTRRLALDPEYATNVPATSQNPADGRNTATQRAHTVHAGVLNAAPSGQLNRLVIPRMLPAAIRRARRTR